MVLLGSQYISLPEIIKRTVELEPRELKTGWVTISATFCTATSKSGLLPNPGLAITTYRLRSLLKIFQVTLIIVPGPCKGEPGLYFTISLSTEMTLALRGLAADDQMLQSQMICHMTAVFHKNYPSMAWLRPIKYIDMSHGCMHILWRCIFRGPVTYLSTPFLLNHSTL